jgi:gamma-glutamyltranspeptidase / glutathione hydrolase
MAASTHWLATGAAMSVLERGGNAFDAAVAAGFVLQVVEPHLNGLEGDMPAVLWDAHQHRVEVICGQGPAPAAASPAVFNKMGLEGVPGDGLLPACVPGAFGAWMLILRDYGTMRVGDVLAYAIECAAEGHPIAPEACQRLALVEGLFREEWMESARVYLAGGLPTAGSVFRNELLANTYRRIVREAEAEGNRDRQIEAALHVFYDGFVSEAIDRFTATTPVMDITGERHFGLLQGSDMAAWRASVEKPLTVDYRGYTVCKAGSWSQAPVFLQQLTLLEGFDLARMGFLSPDHIHTVVECAKLAFADREAWYGDPSFADVPIEALLSRSYAAERRRLVGERASGDLRPGAIGGLEPRLPHYPRLPVWEGHWASESSRTAGEGPAMAPANPHDGDTVHVDVADRYGNLISCTPSGGWFQSSPCIPGLGFALGTRAQQFNLTEGHPNVIAPGKRPRTTLSPSVVLREGEPYLAFGTPGGDQQDQWSLNFFLAHADFGQNLQEAIDAPNFHSMHFPGSFYPHLAFPAQVRIEDRVDGQVLAELERRGHQIRVRGPWALGRVTAAGRDRARGMLMAAASPRGGQAYAAGR